ncbi:hypothetical protein [Methylovulum psychrotolerans]|nr:hypothetical protein [Methylovulum psychrotolerans]
MDEGKHPRTARDALMLEALGDIGDLLAKADALNRTLAPTVAALQHAQTAAIAAVQQHAEGQKKQLHTLAAQESTALKHSLQTAVAQAAKELERAARQAGHPPGLAPWQQPGVALAWALAIALAAGLTAAAGTYFLYGRSLDNEAALGRAVAAVWAQLDANTRNRIEQAF